MRLLTSSPTTCLERVTTRQVDECFEGLGGIILFKRNLTFDANGAIDTAALAAHTESLFAAAEQCPWQSAPIFSAVG